MLANAMQGTELAEKQYQSLSLATSIPTHIVGNCLQAAFANWIGLLHTLQCIIHRQVVANKGGHETGCFNFIHLLETGKVGHCSSTSAFRTK